MMNTNIVIGLTNIMVGLVTIGLCIPLLRDKIAMNRWYGIRFKKSFESRENWHKINRYGAERMIIWSAILVVTGILTCIVPTLSGGAVQSVIAFGPLILVVPAFESWLFARKL